MEIVKYLTVIILFILAAGALYWDYSYLYPRSAIGNHYCKEMSAQRYYETEWDTAGHESCKIGYATWTGTKINSTCMEQRAEVDYKNLSYYGYHCVWGGAGWMAFVGTIAIPLLIFGILIGKISHWIYEKTRCN